MTHQALGGKSVHARRFSGRGIVGSNVAPSHVVRNWGGGIKEMEKKVTKKERKTRKEDEEEEKKNRKEENEG